MMTSRPNQKHTAARRASLRVLASLTVCLGWSSAQAQQQTNPVDLVEWKLVFNQLFALELKKEALATQRPGEVDNALRNKLEEHSYYTDSTFNQTIDYVTRARTSEEAYQRRREHYERPESYQKIAAADFAVSIPASVRARPEVARFLSAIEQYRNRPIAPNENFFTSPEAANFVQAITRGPQGPSSQEVAFVLVPGYAAHTIKFEIFPEILGDANRLYGRPESRPIIKEDGLDLTFEDFRTFYGQGSAQQKPFDILHPAGWEMGNTVGLNAETSDLMAQWIRDLPAEYQNKKLILLGYSKGAPILLEMLERHPDIRERVIGVVTYAGVIQGTHVGRTAQEEIKGFLGSRSLGELIDRVRDKGLDRSLNLIIPFLGPIDLSFVKLPKIQETLSIFDFDTSDWERYSDRLLDGREVRELVDGAYDLAPATRTLWNLRHFDNKLMPPNTFVFNLSAVTDIKTFVRPTGFDANGRRRPSLIAPTLDSKGEINWKDFSLDALFLYASSVDGFKMAPGGLYDTQVELQHTKSPWLDRSPLSASLTEQELSDIWALDDVRARLQQSGIRSFEQFRTTPRGDLLPHAARDNIHAFDLGEIKGHHWSLFLQAFRPPKDKSEEFYQWPFPRKAYMRALLQTMALYNLINQSR